MTLLAVAGCSSSSPDDAVAGPELSAGTAPVDGADRDNTTVPTTSSGEDSGDPEGSASILADPVAAPPTVASIPDDDEPLSQTSTTPVDGSAIATTTTRPGSAESTTTSTVAAPTPPPPAPAGAIIAVDFQSSALGPYTDDAIRSEWPGIRYTKVGDRASIIDEGGNRFVRIRFPKGKVGNNEAGSLWQVELNDNAADELYVAYRVRFVGSGFDFVKGGKLPGLSGGEDNTGGDKPNGNDGWSGRMMWRGGGEAVQYLYHPDQPTQYGDDLDWGVSFAPDRWATVETRIKMNTPGRADGTVEAWFDGRKVLSRNDIRFRDTPAFNVDSFLFHTFFGGNSADWAPTKDEVIDFDDVVISGSPITH